MARPRPLLHTRTPRVTSAGPLPTHDASGRPLLRLQTLGATSILIGDLRFGTSAGTLFSLLLRMVGTPGMQVSAESLRASLWPDQMDARQRANLRQTLYKLRGYGVRISHATGMVVLDETQLLRTFSVERSAEFFARDVTHGLEPFGPYVPGFTVPWPALQEWIDEQRELVHAEVLSDQLRQRRDRADWSGAGALARWMLQFDPLNEEATLTIAECTALSGSKKEALALLDRYLDELGPMAGDIRLPAAMLRRRIAEPLSRGRLSFAPTERHFVGRATELAELTLAMRRARWHDGSAVLLHGPPGIGKSRLAHELEKVARIEGVRVMQASCRESDLLRPLSVFLDLVPELMHQPGALGCAPESLAALRRLLPVDRHVGSPAPTDSSGDTSVDASVDASIAASAPSVTASERVRAGDVPVIAREPMPMAASLRRAIIDVLAAVADERPMLLIVEDVHWIDDHSWDVLSDLIDRVQSLRVFVLLTSREPHARPQRPQRVPIGLLVQVVPPLSPESSLELSRAIGDDLSAPVSDELGAWFVRASEGIPLFLRALVNHWIETGEAGGVPPTLQGVIEQRLSQLSGDALRVLQTAALLGKWATVERVGRVLELELHRLLAATDQLSQIGALRATDPNLLDLHDLLATSVRASIAPMSGSILRNRIATALCAEGAFPTKSCEIQILDLYLGAREFDRAGEFCLSAARTLLDIHQPHRALAVCFHSRRRIAGIETNSEFKTTLRDALYSSGQYARLLADFQWRTIAPDIDQSWDHDNARDVVRMVEIADRAMFVGDFADLCGRGLMIARAPSIDPRLRLRAATAVVRASAMGVSRDLPQAAYATAQQVLRSVEPPAGYVDEIEMYFHTPFGSFDAATAAAERLIESAHNRSTPSDTVRVLGDCAFALMCAGSTERATAIFEKTHRLALQHGINTRASAALFNLSVIAINSKATLESRRLAQDELTIARLSPDPFLEALAYRNIARIALLSGEAHEAKEAYAASILEHEVAVHPKWRAFDSALQLGIAVACCDAPRIAQILPTSLLELDLHAESLGQDFLASRVALALRTLGRDEESQQRLQRYVTSERREAYPAPWFLLTTTE